MRIQFTMLGLLVAMAIFAAIAWNYSPRTSRVVIEKTGRMLDLAIVGEGYFELLSPDGDVVYSRNGRFAINRDGQLIHEKTSFHSQSGICIPGNANEISLTSSGLVQTSNREESTKWAVGQLNLSTFPVEKKLWPLPDGCYSNSDASGQATSNIPGTFVSGHIAQGWLETETPRWTLQDSLPVLMLIICLGAAALQIWLAFNRRTEMKLP